MNSKEELITIILASIGGTSVVVSFLGKVWSDRLIELYKKDSQKEIERLKTDLQKDIESYKAQLNIKKVDNLRYSGDQFGLYNQLWLSLWELKKAGDSLQENASKSNLENFSEKLIQARDEVEKGSILVEDNHYKELSKLLDELKNYKLGKEKLVEIYEKRNSEVSRKFVNADIDKLVRNNDCIKEKYEKLIEEIKYDIKNQLRAQKIQIQPYH